MNTGKQQKILLMILLIIIVSTGVYLWKQQQNLVKVISVVLTNDYKNTQQDWIEGIKTCSSDLDFQVNFFFEDNEEELIKRIDIENNENVSAIITKYDCDLYAKDSFAQGYKLAFDLVQKSRPISLEENDNEFKIGISLYDKSDSFINALSTDIENAFKNIENDSDIRILLDIEDAKGDKYEQNRHIEYFMEQKCDVIAVNIIDTWNASKVINRAKEEEIPVVFFNREPSDEDISLWNNVYYVGTDGRELGKMQGEILTEAFIKNNNEIDKNKDGILQYILVEGEEGHSDSIKRTDAMLKKIENNFASQQIALVSADWKRDITKEKFSNIDKSKIENCEAVICNNDDMALGVLEAIKEMNMEYLPAILGVDGDSEVIYNIENGEILGTISQNIKGQADIIADLSFRLWNKENINEGQKIYISGEKYIKLY